VKSGSDVGRMSQPPDIRRPVLVVALTAIVSLGTLAVMSTFAGWDNVVDQLPPRLLFWFPAAFLLEALAFVAYVPAYLGIAEVANGSRLSRASAARYVAIGFGAFLARGGAALDSWTLAAGATDRRVDGEIRVLGLDALEHAPLAPAAFVASVLLLAEGKRKPPLDFTIPWATLVPTGAVLAFVGVRQRHRFLGRRGWRGGLGKVLAGIALLFTLAAQARRYWRALAGASIYWLGDVLCLWASLKPFHAAPAFPGLILAHAVGYVLTRRTLPLAGAGVIEAIMPLTLTASGAPFAGAILGVLVYRIFNLWLPLIPATLALRHTRRAQLKAASAA
jgi:uncharacterized membrane protein YbhN (UPF0104 family)